MGDLRPSHKLPGILNNQLYHWLLTFLAMLLNAQMQLCVVPGVQKFLGYPNVMGEGYH